MGTYVTEFYVENLNSIASMVKAGNISHSFVIEPEMATIKNNSRFVDPNLLF